MKYLKIGTLIACMSSLIAVLIWNVEAIAEVTALIGGLFLATAMLLSGAFVSGDRIRLNVATESDEGRKQRHQMATNALLLALPNFIVMIVSYYYF